MPDTQSEQVKYYTEEGEQLVTVYPESYYEPGVAGVLDDAGSPWPSIVFVLGSMAIIAFSIVGCVVGLAWILHG